MELTCNFRESKIVNLIRPKGTNMGERKEHVSYLCPSPSMEYAFYQQTIEKSSRIVHRICKVSLTRIGLKSGTKQYPVMFRVPTEERKGSTHFIVANSVYAVSLDSHSLIFLNFS